MNKFYILLFICMSLCSCGYQGETVELKRFIEKHKVARRDFVYFYSLRDELFKKNCGCHGFSAVYTIRGELWLSCTSYNTDSSQYINSDFLDKKQIEIAKRFMKEVDLAGIDYYKDSVCFVFDEQPRVVITYTSLTASIAKKKNDVIDSNSYIYIRPLD